MLAKSPPSSVYSTSVLPTTGHRHHLTVDVFPCTENCLLVQQLCAVVCRTDVKRRAAGIKRLRFRDAAEFERKRFILNKNGTFTHNIGDNLTFTLEKESFQEKSDTV